MCYVALALLSAVPYPKPKPTPSDIKCEFRLAVISESSEDPIHVRLQALTYPPHPVLLISHKAILVIYVDGLETINDTYTSPFLRSCISATKYLVE